MVDGSVGAPRRGDLARFGTEWRPAVLPPAALDTPRGGPPLHRELARLGPVFGVLIPVGPAPQELDRLVDVLDSVRAFEETREVHLVLVDDGERPRDLPVFRGDWGSVDVVRTSLWTGRRPDPYSAMVAGTIDGTRAAGAHSPEFLLKLDTDALLIAPVAEKLRSVFADERVGLVGSYTHTCTGAVRDWSGWRIKLRRAMLPVGLVPNGSIHPRSFRSATRVRALLDRARRNGYEFGAHCLGGAYAVGRALLARHDLLDWRPWVRTGLGEDIVVGVLVAAAGLDFRGSVGAGETFGLGWQSLPLSPDQLIDRGYSIVHSVRDQTYGTESELRAYFRARRLESALPNVRLEPPRQAT
jgi:hypothetical protein